MQSTLPKGFEALAPLVDDWGDLQTADERYARRKDMTMEQLQAYYDLVSPRLEGIFEHLDSFPFGSPLPEPEALLFRVTLAMSEVAQAIEIYGQPTVPHVPSTYSATILPVERP